MNELENNNNLETELTTFQEEVVAKVNKKAFAVKETELTPLESSIKVRRNDLNFPALQAMFELTETELQTILDKLGPIEDCNC
jgi:hypothetical protein